MSSENTSISHSSFANHRVKLKTNVGLFLYGLLAPARTLWLFLRRPSLWRKAIMPVLINFILLVGSILFTVFFFDNATAWLWETPGSGLLLVLWWMLALLIGLLMLGLSFLTGLLLLGPVAAPFLAELSRVVEREWLGPLKVQGLTWKSLIPSLPSLTGIAIKRLLRFGLITLPVMALSFVPVIGAPTAVALEVCVTSFFLAIHFMDAPLSRRGIGRKEMWPFLKTCWPTCLGLGLVLTAMLLIPLAGLLVIPIAVQSATLAVLALEASGRLPKNAPELTLET